jgi:hypothetical protein
MFYLYLLCKHFIKTAKHMLLCFGLFILIILIIYIGLLTIHIYYTNLLLLLQWDPDPPSRVTADLVPLQCALSNSHQCVSQLIWLYHYLYQLFELFICNRIIIYINNTYRSWLDVLNDWFDIHIVKLFIFVKIFIYTLIHQYHVTKRSQDHRLFYL